MSVRTSAIYLTARGMSGVLSVVATSMFAHGIGPEGYGWLAVATAGAALVGGVFVQPVHQSLARFYPRAGFRNLLCTLTVALVCVSLFLFSLAGVAELSLGRWLPLGVALGACALTAAQGFFDLAGQHANSSLRVGGYAALYIAKSLLLVTLGYLAVKLGLGAYGALSAIISAFALSAIVVGWPTWRAAWHGEFQADLLRQIKPYAVPLGGSLFLTAVLMWADRLILASMVSPAETGAFSAGADLTQQGLILMSSAFYLAWYPRLVVACERGERAELDGLANRYATLAIGLLVPTALVFALVRENLVHVFLGAAFMDTATQVIPWLAFATLLGGLRAYLIEVPLHLGGRMKRLMMNVAICAGTVVALNFLLIPLLGVVGAGVAAVSAQALGCVTAFFFGRGVISWRINWRDPLGVAVAGFAMWVAVLPFSSVGVAWLLAEVMAAVVAYAVVIFLFNVADARVWVLNRLRTHR